MGVTIHHGTSFVVTNDLGDITPDTDQGYFHLDTRFLSRHQLRLDGDTPILLQPTVLRANEGWHFLTNPPLEGVPRSTLGIAMLRVLGGGLRQQIEIESFAPHDVGFQLSIGFGCDFAYILSVKRRATTGDDTWRPRVRVARLGESAVEIDLDATGELHRSTITFDPAPDRLDGSSAEFEIRLARRQRWTLSMELAPSIGDERVALELPTERGSGAARRRGDALRGASSRIDTDHPILGRAFDQARRDVADLQIKAQGTAAESGGGGEYAIAAGIPWYMDLFGRDSLIASYQAMLHDPPLARGTLDALARLQGTKLDEVSEEAPGKILHEYRRGPLTPAARQLIPAYPYYGTIDATPLFLITLSEYVRTTGDLEFARDRWDHVTAAVEWMRRYGDRDGDGFLEYQRDGDAGLVNQGWKDSGDSVQFHDGTIAKPPIALVEVQGYSYAARRGVADLARHLGRGEEAERLEEEAAALRRRIAEKFWMPQRAFFAEALDGEKRRVDAITSNPGHLLWTTAVGDDHARAIASVLLRDEMFTGFGIRTLGEQERGYNPVSYHNGSVWPHDNALILHGLVKYGLRDGARRLAEGLLSALSHLEHARPPELFCGYPAARYGAPVKYPTACSPQAWASGAVLLVVRALLGLEVDVLERRIALDPLPVAGMTYLDVLDVPVGDERIDISVRVDQDDATAEVKRLPRGWTLENRAGSPFI